MGNSASGLSQRTWRIYLQIVKNCVTNRGCSVVNGQPWTQGLDLALSAQRGSDVRRNRPAALSSTKQIFQSLPPGRLALPQHMRSGRFRPLPPRRALPPQNDPGKAEPVSRALSFRPIPIIDGRGDASRWRASSRRTHQLSARKHSPFFNCYRRHASAALTPGAAAWFPTNRSTALFRRTLNCFCVWGRVIDESPPETSPINERMRRALKRERGRSQGRVSSRASPPGAAAVPDKVLASLLRSELPGSSVRTDCSDPLLGLSESRTESWFFNPGCYDWLLVV